jgi:hypothetical protein
MRSVLKWHTRLLERCHVFWRTGERAYGVFDIAVTAPVPASGQRVVAELAALHHLLVERDALGSARTGNHVQGETSCPEIPQLRAGACPLACLTDYGGFLRTRFREASLHHRDEWAWLADDAMAQVERLVADAPRTIPFSWREWATPS